MDNMIIRHRIDPRRAYLQANSAAYETLVLSARACWKKGDVEETLHAVSKAAAFACTFHPGRFADGALESIVLDIARRLPKTEAKVRPISKTVADKRRKVLHVASHVLRVGGHTRMLHHWVQHDVESCHSLIVTDQRARDIPKWLLTAIQESGGEIIVCSHAWSQMQRAAMVREVAHRFADIIILHHDAGDVVPILAFAEEGGAPVAVLNHADHLFWLGSSVADTVVSLRSKGERNSIARRFAKRSFVLPIPLFLSAKILPRAEARRILGIPLGATVILSVGRAIKYLPCGDHNFMATIDKIIKSNNDAQVYIVGVAETEILPYLKCALNDRIHLLGEVEDPALYRSAADIYVESFPFGSNTALLEAALCALPVVPAYAPLSELLVAGNDALSEVLPTPLTEDAYIDRVNELIRCPALRCEFGQMLRDRLCSEHVGDGWGRKLEQFYKHMGALHHEAKVILETKCEYEPDDIGLSWWNIMADGKTNRFDKDGKVILSWLRHSAFVEKYVGNYGRAQRFAIEALLNGVHDPASWRLFFASLIGALRSASTWAFVRIKPKLG